jgi:ribosome recycling factor
MNNGDAVIINIPPLTEERRHELVKMAKVEAEEAKISLRSARKVSMDEVKRLEKDGLSEDRRKDVEIAIQSRIDTMVTQLEAKVAAKEVDIMKV